MRTKEEPNWRTVPTAGLTMAEREWLKDTAAEIALRFPPHPVMVNLGIWRGASMYCLRKGAPEADLVGIDIMGDDMLIYSGALKAEIIRGDVEIVWREFEQDIHLLFLDANPREPSTRIQIHGWCPLVVKGGIVAFLSYTHPPPRWGVSIAVDEWFAVSKEDWESIEAPDSLKAFRRRR